MHAAHARNSDQEFLELEFYHDFSRCNPNSHEICMSQIARYIDDRINGRSFSSAYEKLEKEMEARGRDDTTFRADIRAFRWVNNELPVLDIIASPLYFSPPNISTVDFVYAARSYPISVSVFTSSSAVSPRSSAMIYGRDNARERRRCPSRLNVRRRRDVGWRKLLMRRTWDHPAYPRPRDSPVTSSLRQHERLAPRECLRCLLDRFWFSPRHSPFTPALGSRSTRSRPSTRPFSRFLLLEFSNVRTRRLLCGGMVSLHFRPCSAA